MALDTTSNLFREVRICSAPVLYFSFEHILLTPNAIVIVFFLHGGTRQFLNVKVMSALDITLTCFDLRSTTYFIFIYLVGYEGTKN